MSGQVFHPIPPRPAPAHPTGARAWLRRRLFADAPTTWATLAMAALLLWWLPPLLDWAVWRAQFAPHFEPCAAADAGACWGVVAEKYRFILLGRYPYEEQWRPVLASGLLMALLVASGLRACWRRALAWLWLAGLLLFLGLMRGGVAGLSRVETELWGGLPLTLLLSTLSIALAFPLALGLALGRQSTLPLLRALCTVYVELVRGVPLVSVLFMAAFMFPLLLPAGLGVDVLVRVVAGLTLFAAAYLAEVIRGGLQAVPRGQREAAAALGLSWWQTQRQVVLPQALAAVLPALVNHFIGIFKDTSLVTIVSLYELSGALGLALNSDADWRPYKLEAYLFIAALYFIFCYALSRYSLRLEATLSAGQRR